MDQAEFDRVAASFATFHGQFAPHFGRKEAQRRVYALEPRPLAELDAWLEPYRRLWDEHLDRLERHLDRTRTKED